MYFLTVRSTELWVVGKFSLAKVTCADVKETRDEENRTMETVFQPQRAEAGVRVNVGNQLSDAKTMRICEVRSVNICREII